MGTAQDRTVGGAGQHQSAGEQRGQAEERRPGAAEQHRDAAAEQPADEAALAGAERHHQADEGDREAGAERPHVQEAAPEEHQASDDDQRERRRVGGRADHVAQPALDLLADDASLPAQVDERGEEEPEGGEPEADQLRVLVGRAGAAALLRRPPLHARGRTWPQRPLLLPGCHATPFDAA